MTETAARRRIIVLTAPSGAGKTTLAARVMTARPRLRFSVSVTTRPPRAYEEDGVHYHFVSADTFRRFIEEGDLLEYEEVYPGRFYGTLVREVERASAEHPVLLDVDVKGALNVKHRYGADALTLFVAPPSLEVLEQRLRDRNTEDEKTLADRLGRARMELGYADRFDAVVVNDDLARATAETLAHIDRFLND